MSNHSQPPSSPDARKKNPALPSILSNIRNAQAVIGRAADDLHEREIRPLVGSRMPASANNPQLNRSPSTSLSSTIQNFSQRFGSQWRKRSVRRKKGNGVTKVPQSFYIAVMCFFVAFPVFFIIYVLARHAVFGDEGDNTQAHIHEVPSSFSNGMAFESGQELLERNKIDHPVLGIDGSGETVEKQSLSSEGLEVYDQIMGNDPAESEASALQSGVQQDVADETMKQTIGDELVESALKENSTANRLDVTGEASKDLKEVDVESSEHVAAEAFGGGLRGRRVKPKPSSDQEGEEDGGKNMENE